MYLKQSQLSINSTAHSEHLNQCLLDLKLTRIRKRVLILGTENVGKSLFAYNFIYQSQNDPGCQQVEFVEQEYEKLITIDKNCKVELIVQDMASIDDQSYIFYQKYCRNVDAYILIYNVQNRKSLEILIKLRDKLYQLNNQRHLPSILIGNVFKQQQQTNLRFLNYFYIEKKREISRVDGKFLARKWKIPFYEIDLQSCKYSIINQIFAEITKQIMKKEYSSHDRIQKMKKVSFQFRIGLNKYNKIVFLFKFLLWTNIMIVLINLVILFLIVCKQISFENNCKTREIFLIQSFSICLITMSNSILGLLGYQKEDQMIIFLVICGVINSLIVISIFLLGYSINVQQTSVNRTSNSNKHWLIVSTVIHLFFQVFIVQYIQIVTFILALIINKLNNRRKIWQCKIQQNYKLIK